MHQGLCQALRYDFRAIDRVLLIRLYLKSAVQELGQSHAVLCTPDSTYDIRQVQTSNSVFVARPAATDLVVTSTCSSILTLAKRCNMMDGPAPGRPLLSKFLHRYDAEAQQFGMEHMEKLSKARIFEDLPLSNGECERAWDELVAFELNGLCWQPTQGSQLQLWTDLTQAASLRDIDLAGPFSVQDLWAACDSDHPHAYYEALVILLSNRESGESATETRFNRELTTSWILTLIYQTSPSAERQSEVLLRNWMSLLPESWRNDATLARVEEGLNQWQLTVIAEGPAQPANRKASSRRPAARDWHERFRRPSSKA